MLYSAPPTASNTVAATPALCRISGVYQIATQPSSRYSVTPSHRGADGQNSVSAIPATAPPHTIASTTYPVARGMSSLANGV